MTLPNKIITGLITTACLVFSFGHINYERFNWIAISKPLSMKTGETYTLNFKSQIDGFYVLELDTERALEKREQNCRLGIGRYSSMETCSLYLELLNLDWLIYEDDVLISKGNSSNKKYATWGKNIIVHFTKFSTTKNKDYKISVFVNEKDDYLNPTNPRIRASINSVAHKNAYIEKYILNLASSILISTAFITWFFGALYKRYKLKQKIISQH